MTKYEEPKVNIVKFGEVFTANPAYTSALGIDATGQTVYQQTGISEHTNDGEYETVTD